MLNTGSLQLRLSGDREVVFTRVFEAPRQLVFDAMTRPELLKRWLTGPPGWSMTVCEVDLKVGGKYRWVWRGPDGTEMGMGGVHREIVPPERIVCTQLFDEDWTGGEAIGTLVLTESDGKTMLANTVRYASREARDAVLKTPMEQGMAMSYDRLAELLARGPRLRNAGEFCWINMLTPQPALAREFFGKVLDWTYAEIPGLGHRIQVGGADVGGLFDLHAPNTPKGIPPCIGAMVKVVNADAACAKVIALGGKSQPAFDIMNNLRMAVCFDPNGANFDVWESKQQHGTEVDSTLHGAPSWFETLTTDVERATKFYVELFGWTPETMPMPGGMYTVFKRAGVPVAGMMAITKEMGELPPHWGVYFTVRDADAAARAAIALGAKQCVPAHDIAGVGRFCGLTSPQGVTFYVIAYTR
jgi:predicted enzyme related to lactoylglutathione lyase/uncharacterized protein YndB with AHSA1/START domain